ncbi:hypothetical protein CYY_003377 [Polysphondylium violaceum]|uniref:ATP-dependent DNA helicase n=1 Tax=Polysphondylium violaceum TaxID=133409 RepID=A0A8J4V083_9MYCE|nr:hypothetical protein CYY_003377 [Polysphondylium violaceum]
MFSNKNNSNHSNNNNNSNSKKLTDQEIDIRIEKVLKKYFGLNSFRNHQREIIKYCIDKYNEINNSGINRYNQLATNDNDDDPSHINAGDTFVSMATGSGKSLTYQFPSLVLKKTTIVISPLKALISDQTLKVQSLGIKAVQLSAGEIPLDVYKNLLKGYYRIIYVTPEKIMNSMDIIEKMVMNNVICLFAIDECHCLSEWGHDFRTSYRQLSILKSLYPFIPIMALTATSTKEIEDDVIQVLQLSNPLTFRSTKDRPNIFYKCMLKENENKDFQMILNIIKDVQKETNESGASTIIYCRTIDQTVILSNYLIQKGIASSCYHSQLTDKKRETILREFLFNSLQVIVATIAFGMGIDKPDIRLIIHYGPAASIEQFYQESGRCGRDGLPSLSLVLFSQQDFVKGHFRITSHQENMLTAQQKATKLNQMKFFLLNKTTCRRKLLLASLAEEYPLENCGSCDFCTEINDTNRLDLGNETLLMIRCILESHQRFGLSTVIKILRGSKGESSTKHSKNQYFGKGTSFSEKFWKELGTQLKMEGYLEESVQGLYTITKIAKKGWTLLRSATISELKTTKIPIVLLQSSTIFLKEFKLSYYSKSKLNNNNSNNNQDNSNGNSSQNQNSFFQLKLVSNSINNNNSNNSLELDYSLDDTTLELFKILIEYRKNLSQILEIPPFLLFSEKTLRSIAKIKPATLDSLGKIEGLESKKIKDHGISILLKVKEFLSSKNLNTFDQFPIKNNNNNINNNNNNSSNSNSNNTNNNSNNSNSNRVNSPHTTISNVIKTFNTNNQSNNKPNINIPTDDNIVKRKYDDFNSNTLNENNENQTRKALKLTINNNDNNNNNTKIEPSDDTHSFQLLYDKKVEIHLESSTFIANHIKSIRDQAYRNKLKQIK